MLSTTARYALRAVLMLTQRAGRSPIRAETIAAALGAPANYMSKTLHQLAKAGVVEGIRGPSGGFRLAVDPTVLTVAQVVEIFDTPAVSAMCMLGGRLCNHADPCRAHAQWSAMTNAMRAPLTETTLVDLLDNGVREWRDAV